MSRRRSKFSRSRWPTRGHRESILKSGYPGYDTSVGWMAYDDGKVRELTQRAIDKRIPRFQVEGRFGG